MTQKEFFELYANIIKSGIRKECNPNPYFTYYSYSVFWYCYDGSSAYASGDGTYCVTLLDGTEIYLFSHNGQIKAYDKEGNRI